MIEAALEARIARLERENRLMRRGAGALLLSGAAVLFVGQAQQQQVRKAVEAQRFVVKDETGEVRASLGMNQNGGVGLSITGQNRVMIGVFLDSAGVTILDNGGKPRVSLAIRADGSEGLALMNPEGKTRIAMNVLADDTPSLLLRGTDGTIRANLLLTQPQGQAGMLLMDPAGRVRAAFASDAQATALEFMDKAGATRAHLGTKAEGASLLTLSDEKGTVLERHPAH